MYRLLGCQGGNPVRESCQHLALATVCLVAQPLKARSSNARLRRVGVEGRQLLRRFPWDLVLALLASPTPLLRAVVEPATPANRVLPYRRRPFSCLVSSEVLEKNEGEKWIRKCSASGLPGVRRPGCRSAAGGRLCPGEKVLVEAIESKYRCKSCEHEWTASAAEQDCDIGPDVTATAVSVFRG